MKSKNIANNYFAQLLIGIYRRINLKIDYFQLEEKKPSQPVIMFRGNIFYKNSFTVNTQKHYDEVFYLTFCAPEIYFFNEKNEKVFDREEAIENAVKYFEKYDVKISDYFSQIDNNSILCKGIYTAISQILLPIIFECKNDKNELDLKFDIIKARMIAHFSGIELGYLEGLRAVANDYERIFDGNFFSPNSEEFDDTYAIPIDRTKVENDIIIIFPVISVNVGILPDENDRFSLNRIIGNYQRYPFNEDEAFIDPFVGQANEYIANTTRYDEGSSFPLSDIKIPTQHFIPRFFYYITRINDGIISAYNKGRLASDRIDHSEFNRLIIQQAVKDYRNVHKNDIAKHYRHVMVYIEDMIKRISSADYTPLIHRDNDVEACQKFAKHFNVDYEKIIIYIEDEDCVQRVYQLIEEQILRFISFIERCNNSFSSLKLTDEFKRFLPTYIEEHYNTITKCMENCNLEKAQQLKNKLLSEASDKSVMHEPPVKYNNGPYTMRDTFEILERKDNNPFENIYKVLKAYVCALKD